MSFFKRLSSGVKDVVKRTVKPPKVKIPSPIKNVGDFVGDTAENIADTAKDAGHAVGEGAGKVWDTTKPARDTVGKAMEPVLEGLDHADHFLKTGDFGKQVESLLKEQDDTKQQLTEEKARLYEASAALVKAQARLMALDRVDKQYSGRDSFGTTGVGRVQSDVEYDFYADPATRGLEKIGLKPVADGLKFFREIAYLPNPNIIGKQIELAKVRKDLRENIDQYNAAIADCVKSRSTINSATAKIRRDIKELEAKFIAADIEISSTSAIELEVQQMEKNAKTAMAQTLLDDGIDPDIIAQITGISTAELAALKGV